MVRDANGGAAASEGEADPSTAVVEHGRLKLSAGRKLGFLAVVMLALLLFLEGGLRVGYRLWKGTWDFLPETRYAAELYEPHPYLCYVMRPGAVASGYGGETRINRWGFRGRDIALAKPPDVVRVVCLGGSTTFSLFASDNEHTWPAQLERMLNEQYAPVRFEALNFGTPAYCAIDSFLALALRALEFDPDVVVLHDGWNDATAVFRPDRRSDFSHHRGLFTRWDGRRLSKSAIGRLILLATPRFGWRTYEVPIDFSDAGTALFTRYVESSVLLTKPRGIEPVIVTIADRLPANRGEWKSSDASTQALRQLCQAEREIARRWDVPFIDLAATFPKDAKYFADVAHKTDAGLEVVARMIAEGLEKEGVISRVLARRNLKSGAARR